MGIINVTPDSFSDGANLGTISAGRFEVSADLALQQAMAMSEEGASILDIGGESTRPGADPVSVQEELDRVMPVIEIIRKNLDTPLSIDTSSPVVMREACNVGVAMVNDVRALQRQGAVQVLAATDAAVCLMHSLDEPDVMQQSIHYDHVTSDILAFLKDRVAETIRAGIKRERIVIDPGFGFGKTTDNNYQLLRELSRFEDLDLPILVGISRKSMIGKVTGKNPDERLAGSLAATAYALSNGANIIRTHDVAATADVIKVHGAMNKYT
jgi:dihydropteroate synthase